MCLCGCRCACVFVCTLTTIHWQFHIIYQIKNNNREISLGGKYPTQKRGKCAGNMLWEFGFIGPLDVFRSMLHCISLHGDLACGCWGKNACVYLEMCLLDNIWDFLRTFNWHVLVFITWYLWCVQRVGWRRSKSQTVADPEFWIRGVNIQKFRPKPPILCNVSVGLQLHEMI